MSAYSIIGYGDRQPVLHDPVFVAAGARVIGRVEIGRQSSLWYNVVVRGDVDKVKIGSGTNIQDGAVVHEDEGYPCLVGDNVLVGHNAILHGCIVGDEAVIGMGAIVLSGAKIGAGSVVAAGALVPGGKEIPPGSLAVGSPARVVRQLDDREKETYRDMTRRYRKRAMFCLGHTASPDL